MSAAPAAARLAAGALRAVSWLAFPVLLLALLRASDPPLGAGVLARGLVALALLPELCARLVLRAFAATWRIEGGALQLSGALRRIEVPLAAVAHAEWLRVPLPTPGLALRLASGRRLGATLLAEDPSALAAALSRGGVAVRGADGAAHSFAAARAACPRRWWDRALAKIGLASLLPGGVAFYAHQHIAFGALLGEYHLMGLGAWLATAAGYWLTAALYLVLFAGCLRLALEALLWVHAFAAPRSARSLRKAAERGAAGLYYASIPGLLALRFLSG